MSWTPQDTINAIGAITALIAALGGAAAAIITAVKANAKVDAATQRLNSQADSIRQVRDQVQTLGNATPSPESVATTVTAIAKEAATTVATDAANRAISGALSSLAPPPAPTSTPTEGEAAP